VAFAGDCILYLKLYTFFKDPLFQFIGLPNLLSLKNAKTTIS